MRNPRNRIERVVRPLFILVFLALGFSAANAQATSCIVSAGMSSGTATVNEGTPTTLTSSCGSPIWQLEDSGGTLCANNICSGMSDLISSTGVLYPGADATVIVHDNQAGGDTSGDLTVTITPIAGMVPGVVTNGTGGSISGPIVVTDITSINCGTVALAAPGPFVLMGSGCNGDTIRAYADALSDMNFSIAADATDTETATSGSIPTLNLQAPPTSGFEGMVDPGYSPFALAMSAGGSGAVIVFAAAMDSNSNEVPDHYEIDAGGACSGSWNVRPQASSQSAIGVAAITSGLSSGNCTFTVTPYAQGTALSSLVSNAAAVTIGASSANIVTSGNIGFADTSYTGPVLVINQEPISTYPSGFGVSTITTGGASVAFSAYGAETSAVVVATVPRDTSWPNEPLCPKCPFTYSEYGGNGAPIPVFGSGTSGLTISIPNDPAFVQAITKNDNGTVTSNIRIQSNTSLVYNAQYWGTAASAASCSTSTYVSTTTSTTSNDLQDLFLQSPFHSLLETQFSAGASAYCLAYTTYDSMTGEFTTTGVGADAGETVALATLATPSITPISSRATFTWSLSSPPSGPYDLWLEVIDTNDGSGDVYQINSPVSAFTTPTSLNRGDAYQWNLYVFDQDGNYSITAGPSFTG